MMFRPPPIAILLAAGLWVALPARSVSAQVPVVVGPSASTASQDQLEIVRRSLNQGQGLKLDDRQLRFYLEIIAKQPTFAEYTRGYDFLNGPTKGGNPMSHQEFLKIVTPKEMYSQAGITATDRLQFAVTNWLGQSLIRRALDQLKGAKTDREALEIRERIDRELTALTGAAKSK